MNRKSIVFLILVICLLVIGYGFYLFTKGPVNVRSATGVRLEAGVLYEAFEKDAASALTQYAGKVLLVSGVVNTISTNQKNERVIMLKTNTANAFINCTMENPSDALKYNTTVLIKGICSGIGEGDELLGLKGDVYLTRCVLQK